MATVTFSDNVGISGYGVNQSNTEEPSYTETSNTSITWTASSAGTYYVWVKDTVGNKSNASFTIVSTAFCAYNAGQTWNYGYTGGVQSFSTPCNGTYKLEVWGAQGGYNGGYGGYSNGTKSLSKTNIVYIVVGGQGNTISYSSTPSYGGYNGGGNGGDTQGIRHNGGGGGATHMSTTNRGILSNYNSYRGEVLLVAGGGGGSGGWEPNSYTIRRGGTGGGSSGGNGEANLGASSAYGRGASQSSSGIGGTFGAGGSYPNYSVTSSSGSVLIYGIGGGGGGWYGGGIDDSSGGGGGSGYIGGVSGGSMQNGARSGNGYARITLISISN